MSFLDRKQLDALSFKLEQVGNAETTANEDQGSDFVGQWQVQWALQIVGGHLLLDGSPCMVIAHVVRQLWLPQILLALCHIMLQWFFCKLWWLFNGFSLVTLL
jgi:hypothetical protein